MTRHLTVWTALVLLLWASPILADGFSGESFSLRMPAALSRFSSYPDVAGMAGASAARKWTSSIKPASTGWLAQAKRLGMVLTPQYSSLCMADASLHVTAQAFVWDTKAWGVFKLGMAQGYTSSARTRQGLDFDLDMNHFLVEWGKHFGERFALGANFKVATEKTRLSVGPFRAASSKGESYDLGIGVLLAPSERWMLGAVLHYGFSCTRTQMYDVMRQGWGYTSSDDTGQRFLFRPGVTYEYAKDSAVSVDFQLGHFRDSTGTLDVQRFYLGVEHRICDQFYVRGGTAIDIRGNVSWTVGCGILLADWLAVDFAYQGRMFPELEPDFGRSRVLAISLTFLF